MPGICMLMSMSLLFAMHDLNLNSPNVDFGRSYAQLALCN